MSKHTLSLKHPKTFTTLVKRTTFRYMDYFFYALFLMFLMQQLFG
jgi:hypothetical protein